MARVYKSATVICRLEVEVKAGPNSEPDDKARKTVEDAFRNHQTPHIIVRRVTVEKVSY